MPNLNFEPTSKLLAAAYFFFGLLSSIPAAAFICWASMAVLGVSDFEGASGYAVIGLYPFVYLALVFVLVFKFASFKATESKVKCAVAAFGLISSAFVVYVFWVLSKYF